MAVSKRLRYEVLRRDDFTCRYCGRSAPEVKLTVDHVVPRALAQNDDPSNLVAACADCNAGKSSSPPNAPLVADVEEKAVVWAQAVEVAIQRRQHELAGMRATVDAFDKAWCGWADGGIERTGNWRSSIERFIAEGLDERFLLDAVETAMGNRRLRARDVWRYFCGICWTEIKKTHELASQILGDALPQLSASSAPAGYDDQQTEMYSAHVEAYWSIIWRLTEIAFPNERMHGKIAGIQFNACADAESIFAIDWRDEDALAKAASALDERVKALFEQEGVARRPQFPYMVMAESIAADLVHALKGGHDAGTLANDALWTAMPEAFSEWQRRLKEPGEHFNPEEAGSLEHAEQMALEKFSSSCAWFMHQISLGAKDAEPADGS